MLGPVVGSTVLVAATNMFSTGGEYSPGFFGLLILIVVLAMKDGIVGTAINLTKSRRERRRRFALASTEIQNLPPAVHVAAPLDRRSDN